MHQHNIVVEDPSGERLEGEIVNHQRSEQLATRGVTCLPVCPDLFDQSGVGGYMRRAWGPGWPLHAPSPRMNAPMTIFCTSRHTLLHWCARLTATDACARAAAAGMLPTGQLRIATDPSQHLAHLSKLSPLAGPIEAGRLGPPDERGGWVVRGKTGLSVADEGHYGFAIYGHAPGLLVTWSAVSCSLPE